VPDSSASNGAYVVWANNGSQQVNTSNADGVPGRMEINFSTSQATDVSLSVRVNFANADDDSFFFKVDNGTWGTQNNTLTTGWQNIDIGTFSLAAGNHRLQILRREDGARMDAIRLSVVAGIIVSGGSSSSSSSSGQPADIQVVPQTRYQTVDGFGAALPMWTNNMLTSDEVRTLVGTGDDELGLSIIRTIISPNSREWSVAMDNLRDAKAFGENVKILASPWSPPAYMKTNNSTTSGGKLLTRYYGDYATHLNSFVDTMAAENIEIDVVSVQNEPDWHPDYDSCDWSGTELSNFVRDYGNLIDTNVLVGESLRFNRAYTDPSLNDAGARQNFEYVGGHLYSAQTSGNFTRYPLAEARNKHRWMTEWLTHEADGSGAAIWGGNDLKAWNETLDSVLGSVHQSMDVQWNAYIWWWARRFYSFIGDGEAQYGTQRGAVLKRGWAFSHYAKYVRPGYTRVGVNYTRSFNDLYTTAYEGPDKTVVVLLNRSNNGYSNVVFNGVNNLTDVEAYVTSQTLNRRLLNTSVAGDDVILSIPARSVVTLVMSHP